MSEEPLVRLGAGTNESELFPGLNSKEYYPEDVSSIIRDISFVLKIVCVIVAITATLHAIGLF